MKKSTINIITNESDQNQLLNYLIYVLNILPVSLNIIIEEYCRLAITPRLLLDLEQKLYEEMKSPFICSRFPHVVKDLRNNLRASLTAFYNGNPVKIQARAYDIGQIEYRLLINPADALEFLIKKGTRVLPLSTGRVFPYRSCNVSVEYLLLDYQHAYQCRRYPDCNSSLSPLESPALIDFFKNLLTFSNGHSAISFTGVEMEFLKNLIAVVELCDLDNFHLSSLQLEAFLIHVLNLNDSEFLSIFILKDVSASQDWIIYVDNKYPQAIQYLNQFKQKAAQLASFNVMTILDHIELPKVIVDLISQYHAVDKFNIDPLINSIGKLAGSLHDKWSLRRAPMSSFLTLLWAVKYGVMTSLIPRCPQTKDFNSNGFADEPILALTQLLLGPKGLLTYFEKYQKKLKRDTRVQMNKLIKDASNLTQAHASMMATPSFFPMIDKHSGVRLPATPKNDFCLVM